MMGGGPRSLNLYKMMVGMHKNLACPQCQVKEQKEDVEWNELFYDLLYEEVCQWHDQAW